MYILNFCLIEDGQEYGFCVYSKRGSGAPLQKQYRCLSRDKKKVEDFISMLIRNEVSLVHIEDMIDDFFFSY